MRLPQLESGLRAHDKGHWPHTVGTEDMPLSGPVPVLAGTASHMARAIPGPRATSWKPELPGPESPITPTSVSAQLTRGTLVWLCAAPVCVREHSCLSQHSVTDQAAQGELASEGLARPRTRAERELSCDTQQDAAL